MTPKVLRALQRLGAPGARLDRARTGEGFAIYPNGDRRRRPVGRISAEEARLLSADGILADEADTLVLTDAGRSLLLRAAARDGEAFAAQHRPVTDRAVVDCGGAVMTARGHDGNARLRRLEALKDVTGEALLTGAELAAAARLQADWDAGQAGILRGSDWTAAPLGGSARGPGTAQERTLAARCDARVRIAQALDGLALPLRRAVEFVCRDELGLEALERAEKWPARSGKLALKLGLAQIAETMRSDVRGGARGELDAVHHRKEPV